MIISKVKDLLYIATVDGAVAPSRRDVIPEIKLVSCCLALESFSCIG